MLIIEIVGLGEEFFWKEGKIEFGYGDIGNYLVGNCKYEIGMWKWGLNICKN